MASGTTLADLGMVGSFSGPMRNALPYSSQSGSFRATRLSTGNYGQASPRRLGPQAQAPARVQPVKEPKRVQPVRKLAPPPKLHSSLGRRR